MYFKFLVTYKIKYRSVVFVCYRNYSLSRVSLYCTVLYSTSNLDSLRFFGNIFYKKLANSAIILLDFVRTIVMIGSFQRYPVKLISLVFSCNVRFCTVNLIEIKVPLSFWIFECMGSFREKLSSFFFKFESK